MHDHLHSLRDRNLMDFLQTVYPGMPKEVLEDPRPWLKDTIRGCREEFERARSDDEVPPETLAHLMAQEDLLRMVFAVIYGHPVDAEDREKLTLDYFDGQTFQERVRVFLNNLIIDHAKSQSNQQNIGEDDHEEALEYAAQDAAVITLLHVWETIFGEPFDKLPFIY
jgi:hypothetical protein